MAILEQTPLTLAEVYELAKSSEKEEKIKDFIKKFVTIKPEKAREMKKELEELSIIKIKDKHIVKIIDFMPEDASDLNKILEASLASSVKEIESRNKLKIQQMQKEIDELKM